VLAMAFIENREAMESALLIELSPAKGKVLKD
jgi:hypothetical protein